jgi:hypothetical protein
MKMNERKTKREFVSVCAWGRLLRTCTICCKSKRGGESGCSCCSVLIMNHIVPWLLHTQKKDTRKQKNQTDRELFSLLPQVQFIPVFLFVTFLEICQFFFPLTDTTRPQNKKNISQSPSSPFKKTSSQIFLAHSSQNVHNGRISASCREACCRGTESRYLGQERPVLFGVSPEWSPAAQNPPYRRHA